MGYYRPIEQGYRAEGAVPGALTSRYAWLEHEEGTWHFLTSPFSDSMESTRSWSSRQHALDELTREGWFVIGVYPENSSVSQPDCGGAGGYGLMQVESWKCENASTAE